MDQLICASLSHTHYGLVGMLKVPPLYHYAVPFSIIMPMIQKALRISSFQFQSFGGFSTYYCSTKRRPVEDETAAQDEGEWRKTAEKGGAFHGEVDRYRECQGWTTA